MDSERLFAQTCRICSAELENGVLVFGEEGKKLYLQAKIRKYLYIKISVDDKLPKMICESCCKKLEGIHKFATMAVKIQDKFNQLVINSSDSSFNDEYKDENKGLLHTYLTKGIKEKEEVTEMEVKVDPMLILQCSDDSSNDGASDTESLPESHASIDKLSTNCDDVDQTLYNCSFCPRCFTSEIALQSHMWNHIPQNKHIVLLNINNTDWEWQANSDEKNCNTRLMSESASSTTSDECETSENGNSETVQIDQENNFRFTCPICGKVISTKGNLKVHLETHRPKGKYGCEICGRIFKTQCNLYRHKEYHEGIQFPCVVCGRVYPTNSTLRAHSITHSDLRPHKCPLCIKTFKRNQDLKFHINQHTGARPYQCPYCPKAFASSGNCFSHRKRMHPFEVERDREKAAKIMR
ncbi:hypothetical protein PPYR_08029 [Photinus pyralis]|uniref:Protein krueppel n=2 Tax=Photinus pyralis TaxID=7054 RepID=A0A5N4AS77_PHOPY|nr:zinc finger protein 62 homolog [Photinus pyralis]KAB0800149.1 hypothetical protein PPYR_08029 [Photinus pyralis]